MANTVYKQPIVVAEIGCNHQGSMQTALEMIELAKECGANYAKFQKRNNMELLTREQYSKPHPVPYHAFGDTYGEHREHLEFSAEQHAVLKEHCAAMGIGYAVSVWDTASAQDIIALNPDYIKVPSASNNNLAMLRLLQEAYTGDVHVSLGMTSSEELADITSLFKVRKTTDSRLVLYACTSGYPVRFEHVHLLEIQRIIQNDKHKVKSVGFSGHHLGIAIDIAAYTLGAEWIERHFTKDRTWKGTDHAASLEPAGLRKLVRDLQATHAALTYKPTDVVAVELEQREKLKHKKTDL